MAKTIATVVVLTMVLGAVAGLAGNAVGLPSAVVSAVIAPSVIVWTLLFRRRPAAERVSDAAAGTRTVLLEARETSRRLVQTILPLAGTILGASGVAALVRDNGSGTGGAIALLAGVAFIVVGIRTVLRWDAAYKGHTIRFENDPCFGERLLVDGTQVARGRIGLDVTMHTTIASGEGAGDHIVARSHAGFVTFSCRIVVESPTRATVPTVPS